MSKKILLLTLQTFSSTGGIQKMTRTLAFSLNQIAVERQWEFKMLSAYDANPDLMSQYLPAKNFKGFNKKRIAFVLSTLKASKGADIVILSHINLAIVGLMIKVINPKCKIWLIAHGIEVWRELSAMQQKMVNKSDRIICVSEFTKQQMIKRHQADNEKYVVLNNAVDPFLKLPQVFQKPDVLMERYNVHKGDPVIFTLTRLAATEQNKGHELVIKAIAMLKDRFPKIKYILSGKYDREEESRINNLIAKYNVAGSVILTGFIDERELPNHFLLADIFVLPSKKEGFGIVFIEAMACGLPAICGNSDGSMDAIRNGELGNAVDPEDVSAVAKAILDKFLCASPSPEERKALQQQCLKYFGEEHYRDNLRKLADAELAL